MAMEAHEKDSYVLSRFQEYTIKHHKKYSFIEEVIARFKVFKSYYASLKSFLPLPQNRQNLLCWNKQFTGMTPEEFRKT